MKLPRLGWLAALVLAWAAPVAHAADPNDPEPPVVALGNDTYVITRGTHFFFYRNMTKLVERARSDAQRFCHEKGREMKELSVEKLKGGLVIGDFAKARITFKALEPGDPALLETTAPGGAPAGQSDLSKLEELHRSGVLVDAEFEAAKKRLAEHTLEELHNKGVLSDAEFAAARKRLNGH